MAWDQDQYEQNVADGILPAGGRIFGGSADCVAMDAAGNRVPSAPGAAYADPDDGAPVAVWINPDSPAPSLVTSLTADPTNAVCPVFVGPDGKAPIWVEFGGGGKVALSPWDTDRRLIAHEDAADPHGDRAYTDSQLDAIPKILVLNTGDPVPPDTAAGTVIIRK